MLFFLSQSRSVNVKVSRLKVQKSVYSVLLKTEVWAVHVKLGRQARFAVAQNQVKMSNCVLREARNLLSPLYLGSLEDSQNMKTWRHRILTHSNHKFGEHQVAKNAINSAASFAVHPTTGAMMPDCSSQDARKGGIFPLPSSSSILVCPHDGYQSVKFFSLLCTSSSCWVQHGRSSTSFHYSHLLRRRVSMLHLQPLPWLHATVLHDSIFSSAVPFSFHQCFSVSSSVPSTSSSCLSVFSPIS